MISKGFEQEWKVGGLQGPNMLQVCAKREKKKNDTTKAKIAEHQTDVTEAPFDSTCPLSLRLEQCMAWLAYFS